MKKIIRFVFMSLLLAVLCFSCKTETGGGDTYITNNVNIVWKGAFKTAPSNPEIGWAYYNSTEGKSYIWDGSSWQIMAQNGIDGKDGSDGSDGESSETVSVVYIGESTDTVDGTEYVVKTYADVYANNPHFFTYYKYYYLNDNLRKIYMYYHSVGACLLYDYTNYEPHDCCSGYASYLYEYYENGLLERSTQKTGSTVLIYHYYETGKKESMTLTDADNGTSYTYTYYESGNQKSFDWYVDGILTSSTEYFDLSPSKTKSAIGYRSDGSISSEYYYYSAENAKLTASYDTDGSVDDFSFYYESGYLKYYYYSGYLYTYEDEKTTSSSTSSSVYSSKKVYTDEQAKNKISELKA